MSKELNRINQGRAEGTLGQQLLDAAHAEKYASAIKLLAAELGEAPPPRSAATG
jgi:hypothetical protein